MNGLVDTRRGMRFASVHSPLPIGQTSKRAIDIILAISGIVLLAPLLIICFVATVISSRGPAFFRHRRVGFKGKYFDCLKFRTMVTDAPERLRQLLETDPIAAAEWTTNRKLRHDPRVTAIGAILRKSSLDELPQLWNVIKGDMSLVGPRPPVPGEYCEYELAHLKRLDVTPGITGLWQVEARQNPSFETYISLDTEYVEYWSLWLDCKILAKTVLVVLAGTGW